MFTAVKPVKKRLSPDARRLQIVRVASALVAARGPEGARLSDVAAAAGVTRAVVYRFFPSRAALLLAVLADFEEVLARQFRARAALLRGSRPLEASVRGFGLATCDALDEAGGGGWLLLYLDGPDPSVAAAARATRARLDGPWLLRVARLTRAGEPTATLVCAMAVASSRAALSLYASGTVSRERALEAMTRGVRALLDEFRR
ncbi:MAG: TetR/AcrR family transcriptional regulator [Polyangiaceae bacterium]|nr:TetR/AcrR family transcriptional regulator [Polyangiaceae bacterium]